VWCAARVCLLLQYLLQCRSRGGTREESGTLTQGALVYPGSSRFRSRVWESNPKLLGHGWLVHQDQDNQPIGDPSLEPTVTQGGCVPRCVYDYCSTYYKAVRCAFITVVTAVPIQSYSAAKFFAWGGGCVRVYWGVYFLYFIRFWKLGEFPSI
jgi:hypothetical protein